MDSATADRIELARQVVAAEAGHNRKQVSGAYLGGFCRTPRVVQSPGENGTSDGVSRVARDPVVAAEPSTTDAK
jgi:hypothetical protein